MAQIQIPSKVLPGIKIISSLEVNQLDNLINYISGLPIEIEFSMVENELNSLLNIQSGLTLLQTILSFKGLVENTNDENRIVAQNLSDSYIELSKDELNDVKKENLTNSLYLILTNYSAVHEILTSRELYNLNENILIEFSMLTDIKLLFKENLEDKNRAAIISHKLYLEYTKDQNIKELFLTLDIKDLNKLKTQIEKAIQKDQILRDDYNGVLKFLF